MMYRVFLSSSSEAYLALAKNVLWNMSEFALSAVSAADIVQDTDDFIVQVKQVMENAQLFLGIYGAAYGEVPDGATMSYAEQEYHLAAQRGIFRLVFLEAACKTQADERMAQFIAFLARQGVVRYFDNVEDLRAQIVVEVDKFRQNERQMRLRLPMQAFAPLRMLSREAQARQEADERPAEAEAPLNITERSGETNSEATIRERAATLAAEAPLNEERSGETNSEATIRERAATLASVPLDDLPTLVEQALAVASDDIELLVRRALQVHDAQKHMAAQNTPTGDMRVNPIFGKPQQYVQFQADIFMIMPFRDAYDTVYKSIILPVVTSLNLTIKRGDEFASPQGAIMAEVWAALNACKLVIVETTEVNANVYYELGIAHTLGKPAVLLTQNKDIEQIPFDIRHLRFIVYENTISGGLKLEEDLRRTIINLMNGLGDLT